jgi:small membrane protein
MVAATAGQFLLAGLVAALGVYVLVLRNALTDRVAMLALGVIGVVLVVWPGLSEAVARPLGIGRGTDLVFYLFIILCLFRFISSAARTHRLEGQLAALVREDAIRNARAPQATVQAGKAVRDSALAVTDDPA